MQAPQDASGDIGREAGRGYALAVLTLACTFNFLDRQILSALAVPIKQEFALSDGELGLLAGFAFAMLYSVGGIPIARLADRGGRARIVTVAIGIWSLMTAACGLATSFAQLFAARVLVGIGEAGGVAPAYALLCDFFPERQRARALSVYSLGVPVGSAAGVALGGLIAARHGWRAAFITVGLAGLLLVPLLRFGLREPARGRPAAAGSPSLGSVARRLAAKPSFWALAIGASCASMTAYGVFFWMPSFLVRSFGIGLAEASRAYGAIVLVGGIAGIWAGGVLADRAGAAQKATYARLPAIALAVAIPLYVAGVLQSSLLWTLVVLLVPVALGLAWLGPVLTAVQHLVPAGERATATAFFLFINNLCGMGLGTLVTGVLSDALRAQTGVESLRYAILASISTYAIGAFALLHASRRLEADWYR